MDTFLPFRAYNTDNQLIIHSVYIITDIKQISRAFFMFGFIFSLIIK